MAPASPISPIASALGVSGTITTTIGLAALSIIAALLIARQWHSGQWLTLNAAIASGDNRMLKTLIGDVDVSLDDLSPDQKFKLASDQLSHRARARTFVYASILFCTLALMVVVVILVRPSKDHLSDPDLLNTMMRVLPEQRDQVCLELLADQGRCAALAPRFKGLTYIRPTSEEGVVADIVQAKSATSDQLRELSKLPFANVINSQGGGSQLYLGTVPSGAGDILQVDYDCTGLGGRGTVRFGVVFDPMPRVEEPLQGPLELRSADFRGKDDASYTLFARTRGPFSCQI